jgi:monothiol glutaredoxin
MSQIKEKIQQQLIDNPIILYMKGVPSAPECGFSAKASQILNATKVPYTYVNVLKAPFIREKLPSISKWPTYPQLFVQGELVGGCDIIEAMNQDGSLLPLLQSAVTNQSGNSTSTVITKSEVETLILNNYTDAKVLIDGEGCDLTITIISAAFTGQTMIQQHQGAMAPLSEPLAQGRLHAVSLKTYTPEQWRTQNPGGHAALLQIQV